MASLITRENTYTEKTYVEASKEVEEFRQWLQNRNGVNNVSKVHTPYGLTPLLILTVTFAVLAVLAVLVVLVVVVWRRKSIRFRIVMKLVRLIAFIMAVVCIGRVCMYLLMNYEKLRNLTDMVTALLDIAAKCSVNANCMNRINTAFAGCVYFVSVYSWLCPNGCSPRSGRQGRYSRWMKKRSKLMKKVRMVKRPTLASVKADLGSGVSTMSM